MKRTHLPVAVVVGIDGSSSALHAAEWAVDEAVDRDVPLRLVHVIQSTATDIHREVADAEAALHAAQAAVARTGEPVKVETTIARGPVAATLVAESADANLLCLGAAGIALRAPKLRGVIATTVAKSARCPLAIIRTCDDAPSSESDVIAVLVQDAFDLGDVLQVALAQARLRNATLLVLRMAPPLHGPATPTDIDRRLADGLSRYPDVQTRTVAVPGDVPTFLAEHDPPVQLLVFGRSWRATGTRLLGPYGRFVLRGTQCSMLLVNP
jgi:nucleotide-binding universal stress UspA family protein